MSLQHTASSHLFIRVYSLNPMSQFDSFETNSGSSSQPTTKPEPMRAADSHVSTEDTKREKDFDSVHCRQRRWAAQGGKTGPAL